MPLTGLPLKKEIASSLQFVLIDKLPLVLTLQTGNAIEVVGVDPTTTRIKVKSDRGGPRYFKVKISEEM